MSSLQKHLLERGRNSETTTFSAVYPASEANSREVEAVLAPVVDFPGTARSVMAVHYKQASEEQRARFAEVFKWR